MKNLGQYKIWLTGSEKFVQRSVYEKDGKHYIKWYGQMIEVVRGTYDYTTVEAY